MEDFTPSQLRQIRDELQREFREHELRLKYDRLKMALSIKEAAGILDSSESFIHTLLRAGKLERVKIERKTYVSVRSLKDIQKPQ